MKRSAWRYTGGSGRASGAGPVLLLLGGVVITIAGLGSYSYGVLLAFTHMDRPDGPSIVDAALQWIGLIAIPCGVLMVVLSIVWWTWRVVHR